jgi:hypothetical protein
MGNPFHRMIAQVVVITIVVSVIINLYFVYIYKQPVGVLSTMLPFFPAVVSIIFYLQLARFFSKDSKNFNQKYLLFSTAKLFINVAIFVVILLAGLLKPVVLISLYLTTYFVLLTHEVVMLTRLIKKR